MATKPKTEDTVDETVAAAETTDERVELFIPRGAANDEPNLFIAVNGVSFLLPKGKKSLVPKYIADEYYRSQKAQEEADEHINEMLEATKNPVAYV